MPEGPSIVILKEEVQRFKGKKILKAQGTGPINIGSLINRKVVDLKTWGKHLLICLPQTTLQIHLLLFGKYSIDEPRNGKPRLLLQFSNGTLYFYACSVREIREDLDQVYDWTTDLMNPAWDAAAARKKLRAVPGALICDALLDQSIFAGAGNIFKNEVLYRTRVHPLSLVGAIPARKRAEIVQQMHRYAFEFLAWKKANVLKKHWQAHTKKVCPRCDIPFHKAYLGKTKRRTFYCESCQVHYR
ncbi:DNA-formamidopyrimidine glycosylase family protein [Paraflavitalea sp. CAU 1676]|uniref:DNA-formamidopyrimidine glycosylase family protein n=1 Tax=Paraflavitalea sp. CAU 1676 TaxID=3032598 RepID=UPI0023DBDCAA|nr:DNA-formamidopyrimidine glycosylase family protein [Paraflavitalea sp. CAU 1676]MDF2187021.1 endonuclease [Paraflavitalea sp. CAU 1676]